MCETVVDEYRAWQREYLGFVLQPSERGREYEAIEVALEIRACMGLRVVILFETEPFVAD